MSLVRGDVGAQVVETRGQAGLPWKRSASTSLWRTRSSSSSSESSDSS